MKSFPFYHKPDAMNCGPTCLRMAAKHHGRSISLEKIQSLSETTREGSNLKNISSAAEHIGFRTLGVKIDFKKLKEEAPLPCIVHWKQNHFVVVYKITKTSVYVADPAHGKIKYSAPEFIKSWIGNDANVNTEEGIVLLLEPTPKLKEKEIDDAEVRKGFFFFVPIFVSLQTFFVSVGAGFLVNRLSRGKCRLFYLRTFK